MYNWLVVLPPILVLAIAFFTHNIILSVIMGVVSAACIATDFALPSAGMLILDYAKQKLIDDSGNLYLFGFIFILGTIISLINYTGGACAFGHIISKKLKNARMAESSSFLFSFFLCIDDYFSSLTTGCIMQPLTDKFNIPRVKLAYLINTMSSPLVALIPISSWIAYIVTQLKSSGVFLSLVRSTHEHIALPGGTAVLNHNIVIQADPFYAYLKSVPFVFYSFIVIASTIFVVRRRISYGPMHEHETMARSTQNLYGGKPPRFCPLAIHDDKRVYVSDFFVPIITLIVGTIAALPLSGYHEYTMLFNDGSHCSFLESIRYANIIHALFFASSLSFILSTVLALIRKKITFFTIAMLIGQGIKLMYQSAIIISCALIFSALLRNELHTGTYLAYLILPYISAHWLPLIVFIISMIIALGIGSSWGTIAIMFPIGIPMVAAFAGQAQPVTLQSICLLLPTIGAVISGAVAGAQLSPISDPVTMSSLSAGAYQIDHVKTQMPYIIPVIIGTCVAFAAAGFFTVDSSTLTGLICMFIGLITSLSLLYLINIVSKKNR